MAEAFFFRQLPDHGYPKPYGAFHLVLDCPWCILSIFLAWKFFSGKKKLDWILILFFYAFIFRLTELYKQDLSII